MCAEYAVLVRIMIQTFYTKIDVENFNYMYTFKNRDIKINVVSWILSHILISFGYS